MDERKENQKKVVIIGAVLVVILLVFLTIRVIFNRINDSTINLLIAPQTASITIDDKPYKNGEYQLPSGKHTITISKTNFKTISEEINLKSGEKLNYFNYLVGQDGSMDWYANNQEDSYLLEAIIPEMEYQHGEKLGNMYPILKHLPINVDSYSQDYSKRVKYSISYKINLDDSLTLIITDYTHSKDYAYENIKSLGFNPDDFFIVYEEAFESDGWGKAE